MRKMLTIVLVLLLLGTVSFGQTFNPPVKGDKAMLFGFSGVGFLGVFEYQGGFGHKMYLSDKMALRTALMLNYKNDKFPYTEAPGLVGEDGYSRTFGFGTEVAIEIHKGGGKIDPYYGAGGSFFMTTTKEAPSRTGTAGTAIVQPTLKNELGGDAGTNFGAFFLLGMEYYLTDNLSLSGEYHFGLDFTGAPTEVYDTGDGVTPVLENKGGGSTSFGITTSGLLTLAIYK